MNPSSMLASTASETCSELSDEDIRSLLEFIGFGNHAGPFWFLEMEEAGDLKAAELVTRAREFHPIEDPARAYALPGYWADMTRLRPDIPRRCKTESTSATRA